LTTLAACDAGARVEYRHSSDQKKNAFWRLGSSGPPIF
jgi:hypothetical protein